MLKNIPCLDDKPCDWFPPLCQAHADGLLCYGGQLSVNRLLHAYAKGIFPWPVKGLPLLWWCTSPRWILQPHKLHKGRTLKKEIRRYSWQVTSDRCFARVIELCAKHRVGGSWITTEIIDSYTKLHQQGYAHSIEVWLQNSLVGGLYGVAIGRVFCGESVFSLQANAGKVALLGLSNVLTHNAYWYIDCQTTSPLLTSLGARSVSLGAYIRILKKNCMSQGQWNIPKHGISLRTI